MHPITGARLLVRCAVAPFLLFACTLLAACAREVVDAQTTLARELVERIAAGPIAIAWLGDELTEPEAAVALVRMGSAAVPVLIDVVQHRGEAWLRRVGLEVLGRIGDARARPVIERVLARSSTPVADRDARAAATAALGRLASPASVPVLREQLAIVARDERIAVLDALGRCGDPTAVAEMLRLGLAHEELQHEAVEALRRHAPLCQALGITDEDGGIFANELFLQAADEWHHETVLGKRSPWRSTAPRFAEPFAAMKEAAFAALERHVADDDAWGRLRVQGVDPRVTDDDARRDLTLITGYGHSTTLAVHLWCADQEPVVGFRLVLAPTLARSAWPGDSDGVLCERLTLTRAAYRELIAGLRTMRAARLTRWWSGPDNSTLMSTANFVVAIGGLDDDAATARFCGYPRSDERVRYAGLEAMVGWHRDLVAERALRAKHPATAEVRRRFSALFAAEQPRWTSDWWWVRERMVTMARDAGDETLLRPLAAYLEPSFARGQYSEAGTATAAIHALAAITGTDLRFAADGSPRSLGDVADSYRTLLAK